MPREALTKRSNNTTENLLVSVQISANLLSLNGAAVGVPKSAQRSRAHRRNTKKNAKKAVLASFFAVIIEHLFVEKGVESVKMASKSRYRVAKSVETLPKDRNFVDLRRLVRSAAECGCAELPKMAQNPRTKWDATHVRHKWQCCVDAPEEKRLRLLAIACGVSRYQLVRGMLLALLEEAEKGGVFNDVDLGA